MYTLWDAPWTAFLSLLNLKALFWLRTLKGAIVTTVDKESLVVVGEGPRGSLLWPMLYPSLLQSIILSLFLTELLNCCQSLPHLSVLCCYTLPLCACVPVLSASIFSSVRFFFFFASPDRNVQHPKISFPQLMLKQNTTEESLHRWVLENVLLVSSFLLIVVESKEKKSM